MTFNKVSFNDLFNLKLLKTQVFIINKRGYAFLMLIKYRAQICTLGQILFKFSFQQSLNSNFDKPCLRNNFLHLQTEHFFKYIRKGGVSNVLCSVT